ncbi:MAG: hypothetical protein J6580_02540 [Gilliamella sp.]|uniref:hypothetical protein n=1 Tax=Gilliamella sp. TaxID=1891236 RepID=UPI0025DE8827|nr:hypothetical protein [Gilliamella sp.]MCO6549540.1 hypothetical protein [Gilliamella sp.]
MKKQDLSTTVKFETQEVFTRMGKALDVLLNFVDKHPEKTIFHGDVCCGSKKSKSTGKLSA